MYQVKLHLTVPSINPVDVFTALTDLPALSARVPSILRVERHLSGEDGSQLSIWRVTFNEEIIQWVEQDFIRHEDLRFGFKIVSGCADALAGFWQIQPHYDGTSVMFEARFDFGLPQLERVLGPMAAQAVLTLAEAIAMPLLGSDAVRIASQHSPLSVLSA